MKKKLVKYLLAFLVVLLSGYGLLRAHTHAFAGMHPGNTAQYTSLTSSHRIQPLTAFILSRQESNDLKLDAAEISEQQERSLSSKEWSDPSNYLSAFAGSHRLLSKVFSRLFFHRRHIIFQMFRV